MAGRMTTTHVHTTTQVVILPATLLSRSLCQGGAATHVNRWSSCQPHRARQITVSGRSRNTCTQVVITAGQAGLSWEPCQGGDATNVHRWSSLPARQHSAGHRVRDKPQHRSICGGPCWLDHTQYCKLTSLEAMQHGL